VPVLGAGENIDPQTAERAFIAATNKDSFYLAGHLPSATTQFALVAGALHFSFMQLCKPGAAALIEEEAPGESVVCRMRPAPNDNRSTGRSATFLLPFWPKHFPQNRGCGGTVGIADFLVKTVIPASLVTEFVKSGDRFAIFLLNRCEIPKRLAVHPPKPNMEGGCLGRAAAHRLLAHPERAVVRSGLAAAVLKSRVLKPTQGERK